MVQCMFGGMTSYAEQSQIHILDDVKKWVNRALETEQLIINNKEKLYESKFWDKICYDFQQTINSTILYLQTIVYDLKLVQCAIENDFISVKEVNLLEKIGITSMNYNEEYGRSYKTDGIWRDYGNADFIPAEDIYKEGRDFFVTLQDARNAAIRLNDYINKKQVINNTLNIDGNINDSQIQQGTLNSVQNISKTNDLDYDKVLKTMIEVQQKVNSISFEGEFGDKAAEVRSIVIETLEMVKMEADHPKILKALIKIRDHSHEVINGVIAAGIYNLISQLLNLLGR